MRNNLILGLLILMILLMSQSPKPSNKTTICKRIGTSEDAQDFIIQKAAEGYRIVSVTSYAEGFGSTTNFDFLIVIEK